MSKFITQLSVFAKNKPGELLKIAKLLAENSLHIYALTVTETSDFGILRIILNDPVKGEKILSAVDGVMVGKTEVIGVIMSDRLNSLEKITKILADKQCNVEYVYAFDISNLGTIILLQVAVDKKDVAVEAFEKNKIKILSPEKLEEYKL